MSTGPSQEARDLLADRIASRGPAWANAAANVRGGFSNIWIEPALEAIDQAFDLDRSEGEHSNESSLHRGGRRIGKGPG